MRIVEIDTASPLPPTASLLIIYTGGTMGMVYDERRNLVPFDFSQILGNVPELRHLGYRLTVMSFEPLIDSSNMHPAIWQQLAATIAQEMPNYDGFVLLHGTDTMAYTASALSFWLQHLPKAVVCTGAQLPIGAIRNDARRNLVTALEIAAARTAAGTARVPEVSIFFNEVLLRGNRSRKVESVHFDAFHAENYPPLARVGTSIEFFSENILPSPIRCFELAQVQMNEAVALVKIFPGITERAMRASFEMPGLRGVVLETFGAGNAPTAAWFSEVLREAIQRGVVILNVSQCIGGRVVQGKYATSQHLADLGVVSGADITTEAAITKMMFLLGNPQLSPTALRNSLATPLCGEMSV